MCTCGNTPYNGTCGVGGPTNICGINVLSTDTNPVPQQGDTFVFGGGGTPVFPPNASVYYRVTVQSTGPRNTVSYAQALILF